MIGNLRAIAQALGGEVSGRQVLAPGPGHSLRDRSLSIRLSYSSPDGFLCFSHAGDDWRECRGYVRERLGIVPWPGNSLSSPKAKKVAQVEAPRGKQPNTTTAFYKDAAMRIWAEAEDPRGSPVETYLHRRGLALPQEAIESIRFHPKCPFGGKHTRAMVCLVRDIATDEPKAVHRTAIDAEGRKIRIGKSDRLSLGSIAGGAVKITPNEDVTTCLGIGEGIESVLSLCLTPDFGNSPVWSLLNAGGVANCNTFAGIECLWIAVDHDAAGLKAAHQCAERWRAAGTEGLQRATFSSAEPSGTARSHTGAALVPWACIQIVPDPETAKRS